MSELHQHDFLFDYKTFHRGDLERVTASCKCGMQVREIRFEDEVLRRRYTSASTYWVELVVSVEKFFGGDPGVTQRLPIRIGIGDGGSDSIEYDLGDGRHVRLTLEEVDA